MKQVFRKRLIFSIIFIKCDIHGQSGDLKNEESSEWAEYRAKFRKISELDILRPIEARTDSAWDLLRRPGAPKSRSIVRTSFAC